MSGLTPELTVCDPCDRRQHAQCVLLADLRIGAGINRWCICLECRPLALDISRERVLSAVFEERRREVLHGAVVLGLKAGEKEKAEALELRAQRRRRVEVDVLVKLTLSAHRALQG